MQLREVTAVVGWAAAGRTVPCPRVTTNPRMAAESFMAYHMRTTDYGKHRVQLRSAKRREKKKRSSHDVGHRHTTIPPYSTTGHPGMEKTGKTSDLRKSRNHKSEVSQSGNKQPAVSSALLCFSFQTSVTTKVIKVQSEAPVSSYVSKGFLQRRSARLAHE